MGLLPIAAKDKIIKIKVKQVFSYINYSKKYKWLSKALFTVIAKNATRKKSTE